MILIVTNRQDQTADFLILELKYRKVDYVRFNTEDFPKNIFLYWGIKNGVMEGYITFPKRKINLSEITSVWYRRPVSALPDSKILDQEIKDFVVIESQATLEGLFRNLACFWVSNPDNIRNAENKLYQLAIAAELGFAVWPTIITNDAVMANKFYKDNQGDVVYKPLKKGRFIKQDKLSLIYTNFVTTSAAKKFDRIKFAPSLLQKYIHKSIELRTTVIGQKVFTVSIESQNIPEAVHDWRKAQRNLPHKTYNLPINIEDKCKKLVKRLGLQFGAIDLILTPNNEFVFVEINPNGQWAWIQQLKPEIPMRDSSGLIDLWRISRCVS